MFLSLTSGVDSVESLFPDQKLLDSWKIINEVQINLLYVTKMNEIREWDLLEDIKEGFSFGIIVIVDNGE